jgi:large subunit ribosomal protein L1
MDRNSIIHSTIGKASFQDNQLVENLAALMEAIVRATPAGIKGGLLRSVAINTTMGPSIKVNPSSLLTITL